MDHSSFFPLLGKCYFRFNSKKIRKPSLLSADAGARRGSHFTLCTRGFFAPTAISESRGFTSKRFVSVVGWGNPFSYYTDCSVEACVFEFGLATRATSICLPSFTTPRRVVSPWRNHQNGTSAPPSPPATSSHDP